MLDRRQIVKPAAAVFYCGLLVTVGVKSYHGLVGSNFDSVNPSNPYKYSPWDLVQQMAEWKADPDMPPCDTRSDRFIFLDNQHATGHTTKWHIDSFHALPHYVPKQQEPYPPYKLFVPRLIFGDPTIRRADCGAFCHPLAYTCNELTSELHAKGFRQVVRDLYDKGPLGYESHLIFQIITLEANALNGTDDAIQQIVESIYATKRGGYCFGVQLSGGIEHSVQWSIIGAHDLTWSDIIRLFDVSIEKPSTRYQTLHGIGHGFLVAANVIVTGNPYSACGHLEDIDKAMFKISSDKCLAAPSGYLALGCAEGLYHGVYDHASVKGWLQHDSWETGFQCMTTALAYPCMHFGLWFTGLYQIEIYDAVRAYPTLMQACTDAPWSGEETYVRACIFGYTGTHYPIFRSIVRSANFSKSTNSYDALLKICLKPDIDAHVMKVKQYGVETYCPMLIDDIFKRNSHFQRILHPIGKGEPRPLLDWCSMFAGNSWEMDETAKLRVEACVKGAVHFTTDTDPDTDYCKDLQFAPPQWGPKELTALCYRSISWDYQQMESNWTPLMDPKSKTLDGVAPEERDWTADGKSGTLTVGFSPVDATAEFVLSIEDPMKVYSEVAFMESEAGAKQRGGYSAGRRRALSDPW